MRLVFLDFETYYAKDYSLTSMSTQSYIHDPQFKVHGFGFAQGNDPTRWVFAASTGLLAASILQKLELDSSILVCHNASFDAAILAWRYNIYPKFIIDTVSLSRAIVGSTVRSHSLASVAQYFSLGTKGSYLLNTQGVRDLSPDQEQQLGQYCCRDVDLCRAIFYKLIPHLSPRELRAADWAARAFTQPRLLLDKTVLEQHHAHVVDLKAQALVKAGLGSRETLMSNPKFATALKVFGVDPPTKLSPKTGKVSFAFAKTDPGLKALLEHDNPEVQALVAARLEVKSTIEETRALSYLEAAQYGRWPVHYLYAKQRTHRFSGSSGAGGNPQNLTRGGQLRKAICAPVGATLIVGDLAQIELRVLMALAGETAVLDQLRNGEDLYATFASRVYERPVTQKDNPDERQVGKSAVLGLGYGAGETKFIAFVRSTGQIISQDLGARVVKLYRSDYRGVVRLWHSAEKVIYDLATLLPGATLTGGYWPAVCPQLRLGRAPITAAPGFRSASGLWLTYPTLRQVSGESGERPQWVYGDAPPVKLYGAKLVENVCQHLARNIIVEQLITVDARYPVVMTTHDEIVALAPDAEAQEASQWINQIMATSPVWWPDLPLAAKVSTAKRYGDAK